MKVTSINISNVPVRTLKKFQKYAKRHNTDVSKLVRQFMEGCAETIVSKSNPVLIIGNEKEAPEGHENDA